MYMYESLAASPPVGRDSLYNYTCYQEHNMSAAELTASLYIIIIIIMYIQHGF